MERITKYIIVNLVGLLSLVAGLLFSHDGGFSSFGFLDYWEQPSVQMSVRALSAERDEALVRV